MKGQREKVSGQQAVAHTGVLLAFSRGIYRVMVSRGLAPLLVVASASPLAIAANKTVRPCEQRAIKAARAIYVLNVPQAAKDKAKAQ